MRNRDRKNRKTILTLIGFAAIMLLFLFSVSYASKGNVDRLRQSLEKAIQRDVTYCYATTGRYPKTLDYIERVYGLTYDKELFSVDYRIEGSKIPPEIVVTQIGDGR